MDPPVTLYEAALGGPTDDADARGQGGNVHSAELVVRPHLRLRGKGLEGRAVSAAISTWR